MRNTYKISKANATKITSLAEMLEGTSPKQINKEDDSPF
jgi:hypothetical protein